MKKRVIITGATGFIGSNLARRMLVCGHDVHLLLRSGYKDWRIKDILKDVHIWLVDLGNSDQVSNVVSQIRPDWIFHLAAYGAYSSQTNLQQMVDTNLMATANLVNSCANVGFESFINTGSSSEYGYKDHAPHEEEWIEPNSTYAITKSAATHYCRYVANTLQVNLATLRLYSVFGPYEEPTRLIPTLIVEGLMGRLPPLVNPDVAHDYIYIDDVLDAYLLAASKPGEILGKVYNVGFGMKTSLREVVNMTSKNLLVMSKPLWGSMPDRRWDTNVWISNHDRISRELGWQPRYSFEYGFQLTVDWIKSNTDIIRYYQENRESPQ